MRTVFREILNPLQECIYLDCSISWEDLSPALWVWGSPAAGLAPWACGLGSQLRAPQAAGSLPWLHALLLLSWITSQCCAINGPIFSILCWALQILQPVLLSISHLATKQQERTGNGRSKMQPFHDAWVFWAASLPPSAVPVARQSRSIQVSFTAKTWGGIVSWPCEPKDEGVMVVSGCPLPLLSLNLW